MATLNDLVGDADGVYNGDVSGGGPLSLDGTGSMVVTGGAQNGFVENGEALSVAGLDGWTLTAWFRLDEDDPSPIAHHRYIAAAFTDDFTGRHAWALTLTGTNFLQLKGSYGHVAGVEYGVMDPDQIVEGAIYFAALVADNVAGTLKLYKNGRVIAENNPAEPSGAPVDFIMFGGNAVDATGTFIGAIANVKLYGRALSEAEVWQQYLSPSVYTEIPGAPGWYVDKQGRIVGTGCSQTITTQGVPLRDIVADLFQRAGLTPDDYDVSQL